MAKNNSKLGAKRKKETRTTAPKLENSRYLSNVIKERGLVLGDWENMFLWMLKTTNPLKTSRSIEENDSVSLLVDSRWLKLILTH